MLLSPPPRGRLVHAARPGLA